MVEIPWTQFFVTKEHESLFFVTLFRELLREYLRSEQTYALKKVAGHIEQIVDNTENLSRDIADVATEISVLATTLIEHMPG